MNENEYATEVVRTVETKAVNNQIKRKLELVRFAENAENRVPTSRRELYNGILASLQTALRSLGTDRSACENYPSVRRDMAQWERIHRRMVEFHETREMATLVLKEIDHINRERTAAMLALLTEEQRKEVARSAAERQVELENQPRYVKVANGLRLANSHMCELRILISYVEGLLNKGE